MMLTQLIAVIWCVAVVFEKSVIARPNSKDPTEADMIRIGEEPAEGTGIMKRSIMIGSRSCGKGGLYSANPVKSMEKRNAGIDLEEFHKDLHPELHKHTTLIKDQPGPTHVVSKLSNKPQWFERLNRCCIDHENCDKFIPAKEERYNYKNDREYTIYDCRCDDSFAQCLKYADSYTADAVGDLYFNVLKMPCINFQEEVGANSTIDSQSIMDKVNAALKAKQGEIAPEEGKPSVTIDKTEGNGSEGRGSTPAAGGAESKKSDGQQRPFTLVTDKEFEDAIEREAKHFNRNGHRLD